MHDQPETPDPDRVDDAHLLSRRALIGGIGVAGAAGLITLGGDAVRAAPAVPQAIAPPIPGLIYLPLDAFAFDVADLVGTSYRLYQQGTGVQPEGPTNPHYLYASLPIPAGAVVKQINVAFVNQPIVNIIRRDLATGAVTDLTTPTTLDAGGGVKSQTLAVDVALTGGATYAVQAWCSGDASILGMQIGYVPAAQAFIPYTGTLTPRVLDTRDLGARFAAGEERVVDLSSRLIATGRAAVFNLTATEALGAGWLAAYSAGISYPGNSSVNFVAGESIANGVVCTMFAGKVEIKCGPSPTHVIVDVIGTIL